MEHDTWDTKLVTYTVQLCQQIGVFCYNSVLSTQFKLNNVLFTNKYGFIESVYVTCSWNFPAAFSESIFEFRKSFYKSNLFKHFGYFRFSSRLSFLAAMPIFEVILKPLISVVEVWFFSIGLSC